MYRLGFICYHLIPVLFEVQSQCYLERCGFLHAVAWRRALLADSILQSFSHKVVGEKAKQESLSILYAAIYPPSYRFSVFFFFFDHLPPICLKILQSLII